MGYREAESDMTESLTLSLFFHHRKPCSKNDYSPFTQREMRHKKLYKLSKVTQLKICGERGFYRFERDEDAS